jgi:hypothetical protein
VVDFQVLSQHFPGETKKKTEKIMQYRCTMRYFGMQYMWKNYTFWVAIYVEEVYILGCNVCGRTIHFGLQYMWKNYTFSVTYFHEQEVLMLVLVKNRLSSVSISAYRLSLFKCNPFIKYCNFTFL